MSRGATTVLSGEFLIADEMFWATNRTLYVSSTLLGIGVVLTLAG